MALYVTISLFTLLFCSIGLYGIFIAHRIIANSDKHK